MSMSPLNPLRTSKAFETSMMSLPYKLRNLYGKLIIEVSKALLVLNGLSGDIDITIAWESPLPHDDLVSVQAGIAKLEVGVSKAEIQRELGYDPEEQAKLKQIEDKLAIETQQAMLPPEIPGTPALPGQPKPAPTPATAQPAQGAQA